MTRLTLKIGLYFIGIAGVVIGTMFILLGVGTTASIFRAILGLIYPSPEVTGLGNANAESELRFYSVFWIAYGAILIQTARNLKAYASRVPFLLGLFFAGGLARLIACFSAGIPHPLFVLLMAIELFLPVLLVIFWMTNRASIGSAE